MDEGGLETAHSAPLTVTVNSSSDLTPPPAPTLDTVEGGAGYIQLNWTPNEIPVYGYRIYAADASGGPFEALGGQAVTTQPNFTDRQAAGGAARWYKVASLDGALNESLPSSALSAAAGPIPLAAPANLTAAAGQGNQVYLAWDPSQADDLAGYHLYRAVGGGSFNRLNPAPLINPTYLDTVAYDTAYRYQVSAVNQQSEESLPSDVVSLHTWPDPAGLADATRFYLPPGQPRPLPVQEALGAYGAGQFANSQLSDEDGALAAQPPADLNAWQGYWGTPQTVEGAALAHSGQRLFVFGGLDYSYGQQLFGLQSYWTARLLPEGGLGPFKTSENALPEQANGWRRLVDAGAAGWMEQVYLAGGRDRRSAGFTPYGQIWRAAVNQDGSFGPWQPAASLPAARYAAAILAWNNSLFVSGGLDGNEMPLADCWQYPIHSDGSLADGQACSALPLALASPRLAAGPDRLYLLGGLDETGAANTQIYSAGLDETGVLSAWQLSGALPPASSAPVDAVRPLPPSQPYTVTVGATHIGAAFNRGQLWVSGAWQTPWQADSLAGALPDADGQLGAWQLTAALPEGVAAPRLFSLGERLLAFGAGGVGVFEAQSIPQGGAAEAAGYLSAPIDYGLLSEIEYLTWQSSATGTSLRVRSGGPDWGEWSAWSSSPPLAVDSPARYVQFEVRWEKGSAASIQGLGVKLVTPPYSPPVAASQVISTPGGVLENADSSMRLIVPEDALAGAVTFGYTPLEESAAPPVQVGPAFSLSAQGAGGAVTAFQRDLILRVRYDPARLEGRDPHSIFLYIYDPTSGMWSKLPGWVDPLNQTVITLLRSLPPGAIFAPIAEPQRLYLPVIARNP